MSDKVQTFSVVLKQNQTLSFYAHYYEIDDGVLSFYKDEQPIASFNNNLWETCYLLDSETLKPVIQKHSSKNQSEEDFHNNANHTSETSDEFLDVKSTNANKKIVTSVDGEEVVVFDIPKNTTDTFNQVAIVDMDFSHSDLENVENKDTIIEKENILAQNITDTKNTVDSDNEVLETQSITKESKLNDEQNNLDNSQEDPELDDDGHEDLNLDYSSQSKNIDVEETIDIDDYFAGLDSSFKDSVMQEFNKKTPESVKEDSPFAEIYALENTTEPEEPNALDDLDILDQPEPQEPNPLDDLDSLDQPEPEEPNALDDLDILDQPEPQEPNPLDDLDSLDQPEPQEPNPLDDLDSLDQPEPQEPNPLDDLDSLDQPEPQEPNPLDDLDSLDQPEPQEPNPLDDLDSLDQPEPQEPNPLDDLDSLEQPEPQEPNALDDLDSLDQPEPQEPNALDDLDSLDQPEPQEPNPLDDLDSLEQPEPSEPNPLDDLDSLEQPEPGDEITDDNIVPAEDPFVALDNMIKEEENNSSKIKEFALDDNNTEDSLIKEDSNQGDFDSIEALLAQLPDNNENSIYAAKFENGNREIRRVNSNLRNDFDDVDSLLEGSSKKTEDTKAPEPKKGILSKVSETINKIDKKFSSKKEEPVEEFRKEPEPEVAYKPVENPMIRNSQGRLLTPQELKIKKDKIIEKTIVQYCSKYDKFSAINLCKLLSKNTMAQPYNITESDIIWVATKMIRNYDIEVDKFSSADIQNRLNYFLPGLMKLHWDGSIGNLYQVILDIPQLKDVTLIDLGVWLLNNNY